VKLHQFESDGEPQDGERGSSFAVKSKIESWKKPNGKQEERIYFYAAFAKTPEGREYADGALKNTEKEAVPLEVGKRNGALWFLVSWPRKALKKWQKAFGLGAILAFSVYLLNLAIQYPEIKDLIKLIINDILP